MPEFEWWAITPQIERVKYWALENADRISRGMVGRSGLFDEDAVALVAMMMAARDGDHVDIGAAYGASAILAALTKRHFGHTGYVFAMDPLDGRSEFSRDATSEYLFENMRRFKVGKRVYWVASESQPWPFTKEFEFASAFIDGDHDGETPLRDWQSVAACTSRYVMFHDYPNYEGVKRAGDVARADPAWEVWHEQPRCLVLRRRM